MWTTLLDIFKKWFFKPLDYDWRRILLYNIKGSIWIISNLKYSYLKVEMPEQKYALTFLHTTYNSHSPTQSQQ